MNICTLSDYNYLAKGLVMWESLLWYCKGPLTVHYLCLDDKTFDKVSEIDDQRLVPTHVDTLVSGDSTLKVLRDDEYKYFCWCLASYFTRRTLFLSKKDVAYVDSDICFYDDFQTIVNAIGRKDVGVFRHRQFPLEWNTPSGKFNVGVVYFKNTAASWRLLDWWAEAVLHKKHPELATCGDQRYLDAFLELKDHLSIDPVGHGSPWEWQLYDYSEWFDDGYIIWNGVKEKLVFSHLSQFEYDIEKDKYIPSTMHHCYTPLEMYETRALKDIYDVYFDEIKDVTERYSL